MTARRVSHYFGKHDAQIQTVKASFVRPKGARRSKGAYTVCTTAKMRETTGTAGKILAALVFCSQHLK
jgi:hypothetical protein